MNILRKLCCVFSVLALSATAAYGQAVTENIQDLSKKSEKGFLYDASKDAGGNLNITYKIKGDKKSDDAFYERYSFDKSLKLIENKEINEPKEDHADYEKTTYFATVGGCSSFDILSMKLKLNKVVALKTWSHEKQRYITKKRISSETIKAKNEEGKVYYGYATYLPSDDNITEVFTLAKIESKEKGKADNFYVLLFDDKLEIKEIPVPLEGAYSLVYTEQVSNDDVIMVFAPQKGSADISKYIYLRYDIKGNIKNKSEFSSPASAMLLTACYEKDGNVYFCGSSVKSKSAFENEFSEYASILNPCFNSANNKLDMRWEKDADKKMENFHLLKFSGNQLAFASTIPISEFKSKFRTSAKDKGASPYKGKKFDIKKFYVTPEEDYLIAGQLTGTVHFGATNPVKSYEDIICLHFDKMGALKAQYGVEKQNDDKKSEIFEMPQNFYLSADGKNICWEIMEVKGFRGYESFWDAYNGSPTFYPKFYPRIGKIDLANSTVSEFQALGQKKYYLNRQFIGQYDAKESTMTYIGHDEKFKKLWLGKVVL